MSSLQIAILGSFALTEEGQPIELNIAKLQALLAYLAVTAKAQTREQILTLLWAESHPDAARKNLRNRLWQLRQQTVDDLLITEGETLALAPTVQSDVTHFERGLDAALQTPQLDPSSLTALLALWRGPLLDGLQLHEAPDFELWLAQQRERLGQRYLQAIQALLTHHATRAEWHEVVTLAQRGLAHDPYHEPLYQQLMIGHAQLGQRSASLRQYDRLQVLFSTELALSPLPETEEIRRLIAAGQPLPGATQPPQVGLASGTSVVNSGVSDQGADLPNRGSQPFIGRVTELATLTAALQQSQQGHSRVVLLSGELGMGKSTLWQQWSSQLTRRDSTAIVLASRCLNTTQSLPFEPMRRLLGTVRCREQWARMADQLQPIWQAELLRLAPTLRAVAVPQGEQPTVPPTALSPNEERGLIAEALTQFVRAFQGNPLVLFLDDIHWADSATLDWLLYLTDRMANEPLLLVVACRPNEMSAHLVRLIAQWQREGLLKRIDLPHFTEDETTALLTALGTDATVIEYLHTQSGGNPYYLTQLSDVAVDGIPAPLTDLVLARLRYLDERWQPVLQAAAILEPTINLHLLSATSGRTEEETVDALDGLLAAAILTEHGDEYEFTHPLVATVMRDSLSNSRRRLLHRRAAEGLLSRHGTEEVEIAGQLAHHFAAAGEHEQAAHFATVTGAAALRIGAANEAVAFYQQAMQLMPTAERQLGLGQALMLQPGQTDMARQAMEAALLAYERIEDDRGVIKAGLHLAASYLSTQDGAQVLHWARRVLPDLESIDDPTLHASAHYLMGTAQFRNGYPLGEAESHFRKAMALVDDGRLESEVALMSCFEWGNLCLERGQYTTAVAKFQQAQVLARQWQSIFFEVLSLNNLAYALLLAGKQSAAQQTIDQAFILANRYVLPSIHYYLMSTQGEIALATGALTRADNAFQQAMALVEKYDNPTFVANLWAHRGRVAYARGELAVAHEQLARPRQMVAPENALFLQTQIDLWFAAVVIDQLDYVSASALLSRVRVRLALTEYDQLQRSAAKLQTRLMQLSN